MAVGEVIHMGENSLEFVVYKLFLHVVHADRKALGGGAMQSTVDRKYILHTYQECLQAVKGVRLVQPDE